VEAFPVEVLTPLGAGDAFAAGLLWARLRGRPWEEALLVGNACGAIVASRLGCGEFSPTREELVAFLRERGFHVD
jgi:5-dehydro-2-deoxygluconokinase